MDDREVIYEKSGARVFAGSTFLVYLSVCRLCYIHAVGYR